LETGSHLSFASNLSPGCRERHREGGPFPRGVDLDVAALTHDHDFSEIEFEGNPVPGAPATEPRLEQLEPLIG
jgi:hypothetical protein